MSLLISFLLLFAFLIHASKKYNNSYVIPQMQCLYKASAIKYLVYGTQYPQPRNPLLKF